jgi:hypothetical protein
MFTVFGGSFVKIENMTTGYGVTHTMNLPHYSDCENQPNALNMAPYHRHRALLLDCR